MNEKNNRFINYVGITDKMEVKRCSATKKSYPAAKEDILTQSQKSNGWKHEQHAFFMDKFS